MDRSYGRTFKADFWLPHASAHRYTFTCAHVYSHIRELGSIVTLSSFMCVSSYFCAYVPWCSNQSQRTTLGLGLRLLHCLIQDLLVTTSYSRLAGLCVSGDSPISTSHLTVGAPGLRVTTSASLKLLGIQNQALTLAYRKVIILGAISPVLQCYFKMDHRPKCTKSQEESIGNLCNLRLGKDFLDVMS